MKWVTITRLEVDQRNPNRVRVEFDGAKALKVPLSVAAALHVGQRLAADELARLREASKAQRALDLALRYLAYRSRSTAEVVRYLREKGFPEHTVEHVTAWLTERGWLDDLAFARWWVENRTEHRPRGRLMLAAELRQKGVPDACIEEALAALPDDEEELARRAAERFVRRLASVRDRTVFVRRLSAHLARRGFSWEVVRSVVEAMWAEHQVNNGEARRHRDIR